MSSSVVRAVRRFRLQYVSDLHLEAYDKIAFPLLVRPAARYLVLAGDIGQPTRRNYNAFLSYCSSNWEKVFYVPGNHEYSDTQFMKRLGATGTHEPVEQMHACQAAMEKIVGKYRNIHIHTEDAPSFYVANEGVAIVGQTLWTDIPKSLHAIASRKMDGRFSAAEICRMHHRQKNILAEQIQYWRFRKTPVCVITHHMPSFAWTTRSAVPCEGWMGDPVRAWIYGHTHNTAKDIHCGTITAVNARGYPREIIAGFSTAAVLECRVEEAYDGALPELAAAATRPLGA